MSTNEPKQYLAEFSFSKRGKILNLLCGLVIIAGGIVYGYVITNFYDYKLYDFLGKKFNYFLSVLISLVGILAAFIAFIQLRDKEAKLKLAKEGLWTKELGFIPWSSIRQTLITIDTETRYRRTFLEIFLKDNDTQIPNQKLLIHDLKNMKRIKPMIDELFR